VADDIADFTGEQLERYARHIILPDVGGAGQTALMRASVLVVGAGGLGAPIIQYLAAAGLGRLVVIDDDAVDLSNLQRQVIHATPDVGRNKAQNAAAAVARLNPEVKVEAHAERLTPANVEALVAGCDVVLDGTDNFATRYLLNDACWFAGVPLVSAALLRFEGQLFVSAGAPQPCYRCLFPEAPKAGTIPSCSEAGVFGALAGVMGALQATEALKLILGRGTPMSGRFLLYDALSTRFTEIKAMRNPACPLCGDAPTIRDLSHHA